MYILHCAFTCDTVPPFKRGKHIFREMDPSIILMNYSSATNDLLWDSSLCVGAIYVCQGILFRNSCSLALRIRSRILESNPSNVRSCDMKWRSSCQYHYPSKRYIQFLVVERQICIYIERQQHPASIEGWTGHKSSRKTMVKAVSHVLDCVQYGT